MGGSTKKRARGSKGVTGGGRGGRRGGRERPRVEEEHPRCPITHQHLRTLKEVGLLGSLWPAERLVLGLRVCHWLRRDLFQHAESVVLVSSYEIDGSEALQIAKTLKRFSNHRIVLKWDIPLNSFTLSARCFRDTLLDGMEMAHEMPSSKHAEVDWEEGGGGGPSSFERRGHVTLTTSETLTPSHALTTLTTLSAEKQRLAIAENGCVTLTTSETLRIPARSRSFVHGLRHLDVNSRGEGPGAEEGIGAEGATRLASVLAGSSSLQTLRLSYQHIGAEGMEELSTVLKQSHSLSDLDLSGNNLEHGIRFLSSSPSLASSLRRLDLSSNLFPPPLANKRLPRALANLTSLTYLSLRASRTDTAPPLLLSLHSLSSLRHLDLSYTFNLDNSSSASSLLANVLSNNPALTCLSLKGTCLGPDGVIVLASALQECNGLQRLDLAHNKMKGRGAMALAKVQWGGFPALRYLEVQDNQFGASGTRMLAEALVPAARQRLEQVRIGGNSVGNQRSGERVKQAVRRALGARCLTQW